MRTRYFGEVLKKPGMLIGTQCFTGHPAMVEILGGAGWDWVSLDMEHAPNDFMHIEHLVRAAECGGIVPLVRIGKNDPLLISKALDTGAAGVIVPHISSVADLQEAVASTQYPPHGNRGACGATRALNYGWQGFKDYIPESDKGVTVIPLIEDSAGIDAFDDLLKVKEVSVYWIGIADLTVSLGLAGADFWHPELDALARSLNKRAKAAGKELMIAAAPHLRADYVQHLFSLGFRLVSIGTDLSFYRQSLAALTKQIRP